MTFTGAFRVPTVVPVVAAMFVLGCASAGSGHATVARATTTSLPAIVRGIYASWPYATEYSKLAALGFNAVSVEPWHDRLDYLESLRLKALVWLGGYDNSTCTFVKSNAWVKERVSELRAHPAVLAYEIDNEPHAYQCPTAPRQIKDRVSLVRSLVAPYTAIAYITLSRDFSSFSDTGVDLIRISAYPCSYEHGCVMQKIDSKVAAAHAAGFERIWGGSQTAGDSYYRAPSPVELAQIQQTWRSAGAEGYVAWAWDAHGTTTPLRTNTALWDAWKVENAK